MLQFKKTEHADPHWRLEDIVGFIPSFVTQEDVPAAQQFDKNYGFAGGWRPMSKWSHLGNGALQYPGEPVLHPLAEAQHNEELIRVYSYGWVAIFQPDGSFEISRMD